MAHRVSLRTAGWMLVLVACTFAAYGWSFAMERVDQVHPGRSEIINYIAVRLFALGVGACVAIGYTVRKIREGDGRNTGRDG
jgi:hypothetical protein